MTNMKKSLFSASFEESLNLEDDGFLQYQKKDVYSKLEKYYVNGKPKISLRIQGAILTLIGPILMNFMLLVVSMMFHDSDESSLRIMISKEPILTVEVYLICLIIWLLLVLIGKVFRQAFVLPYRYHFHVITFLLWFIMEINFIGVDLALPNISPFGILLFFCTVLFLSYLMLKKQVSELKKRLYKKLTDVTFSDRLAKVILGYGGSLLGLAIIIKYISKAFSVEFSSYLTGIGFIFLWGILNIAIVALVIFIEFPTYLHVYYKLKYPEEYREWEGKSLEEWYGKKYLKKHKELLEHE
ncbi:hypothetical protein SAMN05216422_0065 [Streptococcus equinus]|nr:hypothetical protein [Streptococcus equinus]UOC11119.1 hypothetical protein KIP81_09540 [Streptococcus equinus]SFQ55603.1 hypothetical protein SAMN05216422_0065 [Streptococcus equinus]